MSPLPSVVTVSIERSDSAGVHWLTPWYCPALSIALRLVAPELPPSLAVGSRAR